MTYHMSHHNEVIIRNKSSRWKILHSEIGAGHASSTNPIMTCYVVSYQTNCAVGQH